MKTETLTQISLFTIIFLSLCISFFIGYEFNNLIYMGISNKITNYSNCNNLSLEDTADCINKDMSSWFVYNHSQVGKELSLEEFKQQGGVCSHASDYSYKLGRELGFESTRLIFKTSNNQSHVITAIANKEGYCLIEQKAYSCWEFDTG